MSFDEILRRLGYSESEIRELKRKRVQRDTERGDRVEVELRYLREGQIRTFSVRALEQRLLLEVRLEDGVDLVRELLAHVGGTLSRIACFVKGRS